MSIDTVMSQLEEELHRAGWRKIDFCRALKISTQAYNHWRHRGIPWQRRHRVAKLMGWDPEKLLTEYRVAYRTDNGTDVADKTLNHGASANIEAGPRIRGWIPMISWVQAGEWSEAEDPLQDVEPEEYLPCPVAHGPRTFGVRVTGESMIGHRDAFPPGTIIFVDPDAQANPSDYVVATVDTPERQATFKQLVYDAGVPYLRPLNQQFPILEGPFEIIGRVIGSFRPT